MKDNGVATATGTQTLAPVRRGRGWTVLRLARALGVGALAGVGAGAIGGLAARLAMRISGALTGPECARLVTENGNDCGAVTGGGTAFLVVFGAIAFGGTGGVLYASIRPWLANLGRRRGMVFGLLLFAIAGHGIVDSGNEDFHRFGTPAVNVLVFFLLFPLFGIVITSIHDRLHRRLPNLPPPPGSRHMSLKTLAYAAILLPAAIVILLAVGRSGETILVPLAVLLILALPPLAHHELTAGRNRRVVIALTILAALPYAIGAVITARSVLEIL